MHGGARRDDAHMDKDTVDSPLIGASDLGALLGTPNLLVVDCRFDLTNPAFGPEAYAAGHLAGAVFASVENDLAAPARCPAA